MCRCEGYGFQAVYFSIGYINIRAFESRIHRMQIWRTTRSAPGTSCMNSVIAWDELHESEASEASVFCFDNASSEKSCFVDGLVCFISLCLRVFEFLHATRRE